MPTEEQITIDNSLYLSFLNGRESFVSMNKGSVVDFVEEDFLLATQNQTIEGDKNFINNVSFENLSVSVLNIDTDKLTEGSLNLYFSDERAREAVGSIMGDTSSVDITYDGTAETLKFDLISNTIEAEDFSSNLNLSSKGFDADKIDGKDVNDSDNTTNSLWSAEKIISYLNTFKDNLDWQDSIISSSITDPSTLTPSENDRYFIEGGGAGDWSGRTNVIAEYNGSSWDFISIDEGTIFRDEEADQMIVFDGAGTVNLKDTIKHEDLSGLQGGDGVNQFFHLTSGQYNQLVTAINADSLHIHTSSALTNFAESVANIFNSKLAEKTTDDLTESLTKLYFTDDRIADSIDSLLLSDSVTSKTYDDVNNTITLDLLIDSYNTDDLAQGTENQFFTNEKVDDRFNQLITSGTGIQLFYDDPNNLYVFDADLSASNTDDLVEGMNKLYFDEEKAIKATSGMFIVTSFEALSANDFVMLFDDNGTIKVKKADASNIQNAAFGFVKENVAAGNQAKVILEGLQEGYTNLIPGKSYFLSLSNPGTITDSAPSATDSIIQVIGVAETPSVLRGDIEEPIIA